LPKSSINFYKKSAVLTNHITEEESMKKISMLLGSIALAVLLLGASNASAQVLNDTWFKLNVSAKGYAVGMDDSVGKVSFKATVYMLVQYNGSDRYNYYFYSETSPGTFQETRNGNFSSTPSGEVYFFLSDKELLARASDGAEAIAYITGMIKVKLDAEGGLASATFQSLGAEVYDGETPDGDTVYGGLTVKGKICEAPPITV